MVRIRWSKDFFIILFLILIAFIPFKNDILRDKIIYGFDTPKIVYPFYSFLSDSFKNKELPLWTPYIYGGYPISAEGQLGLFYPANLVFAFLSQAKAMIILTFLHVFLAGFFAYIFARILGITRAGSLIAALIFMFSGTLFSHLQFIWMLEGYVWLPLILFFAELGITKKKLVFFSFSGATLAIQFFSGHPNNPVISLIVFSIWVTSRLFSKEKLFLLKSLSVTILTLTLLLSVRIFELAYLVPKSVRSSGVSFEDATNSSFSFFDFITFLFPNFYLSNFSSFWTKADIWHFHGYWGAIETVGYVGILPLFLSLFSIFSKNKTKNILILLIIVSLVLSLGKNTPIYRILFMTPFFGSLRSPGRFLFLFSFATAFLAALGFDAIFGSIKYKKLIIALLLIFPIFIVLLMNILQQFTINFPETTIKLIEFYYLPLGFNLETGKIIQFLRENLNPFTSETLKQIILLFFSSALLIISLIKPVRKLIIIFVVFLIILDLWTFGLRVNEQVPGKKFDLNFNSQVEQIKNQTPNFERIYTPISFWSDFMPNQTMPAKIFEANGFSSLELIRFSNYRIALEEELRRGSNKLVRLLSAKFITNQDSTLVPNNDSLPRTYIVYQSKVFTRDQVLSELISPSFNPRTEVVLEEQPKEQIKKTNTLGGHDRAKIISYRSQKIEIETTANSDGFLVLTDTYYPGWKAYLDGKTVKIYQANYLFRAIFLPYGKHNVTFIYKPLNFYFGLIITILTLIIILLCALFIGNKSSKRKEDG